MTDDVPTLQFVVISIAVLFLVVLVLALQSVGAAYRNGVTDGYGYSKEPNCPGYAAAGEYLRAHMKHRWSELELKPQGKPIPPQGGSGTARVSQFADIHAVPIRLQAAQRLPQCQCSWCQEESDLPPKIAGRPAADPKSEVRLRRGMD